MAMFIETGTPGLTLLLLCVIAALTTALVGLFWVLEQSKPLARLRTGLIRQVDRQMRRP